LSNVTGDYALLPHLVWRIQVIYYQLEIRIIRRSTKQIVPGVNHIITCLALRNRFRWIWTTLDSACAARRRSGVEIWLLRYYFDYPDVNDTLRTHGERKSKPSCVVTSDVGLNYHPPRYTAWRFCRCWATWVVPCNCHSLLYR